ncbi:hypothetical protein [Pendulispora albinea]|uniref:Uncharacterized protein n=1 Tax=Pendulispora albinea TaxID=2741071 RepID=A0ABZ2LP54_9BACT
MSELKTALLAIFQGDGRERVIDTFRQVLAAGNEAIQVFTEGQTVEQISQGYLSLILEHIQGEKRDVRDYWIETITPALMEQGQSLEEIARSGVRFSVIFAVSVVSALPPELRIAGTAWAAEFHSGVQADMTRVCLDKLLERRTKP